jgi:glucokinase
MLLVGDIGGTKTTVALYSLPLNAQTPIFEMTFKSSEFTSLKDLVKSFLRNEEKKISAAVFGAAGPVIDGSVKITNLPWKIVDRDLENELSIEEVWIINDLEAIANAIPYLSAEDFFDLHEGVPEENGTMAVIAPGTGLGEAYLTWDEGTYHPHASEGGHSDFAPISKKQADLLAFMFKSYDHVSYERLCSGIGIPNIYSFVLSRGEFMEPSWLTEQLAQAADPTPIIVKAAGNKEMPCPLCNETVQIFTSILGAECGNMALKFKATGGVYLGGGMIPKMLDVIDLEELRSAYVNKGRFKEFVSNIPIRLILNPEPGIIGAAHFGEMMLLRKT